MDRMDTGEDDDFNTRSKAFASWLKQNGASISPKIRLADLRDQHAGRGVVATDDLAEDEELFSVPRSSILTLETTTLPDSTKHDILQDNNDPWLSLIAGMVLEYLKGIDSPWAPYLDILPENFDSLMFWTEAELEYLDGSAVLNKIGKEGADTTFEEQLIPKISSIASSLQLSATSSNPELLALCHRMGSTIMAYAFDLEKSTSQTKIEEEDGWEEDSDEFDVLPKGMIPMADMLNADADRNNAKLFYEDDKVVMKTIKPVKAGEELYNDFGNLPRADLLRRYGYVTNNYAKYDVVEITLPLIKDQATKLVPQELEEKWAYAEEQGVLDDGYDIAPAASEDGQFPEELRVLLNLLVTPKAEFDKLKKKDKLPKPDHLTPEAEKLLRTILVHRYAQYPADLELPMNTLDQVDERRRDMARQVIRGEKEIVREAVTACVSVPGSKKRGADTLEDEAAEIRNPTKK